MADVLRRAEEITLRRCHEGALLTLRPESDRFGQGSTVWLLRTLIFIVQKAGESTAKGRVPGKRLSPYVCRRWSLLALSHDEKGAKEPPQASLIQMLAPFVSPNHHRKPYFSTETLKIRFHYMGGGVG